MKPPSIKLESRIPIPKPATGKPKGSLRLAMERMKVGQSFQVPRTFKSQKFAQLATAIGIKICTRQVNCESRRIWRVK